MKSDDDKHNLETAFLITTHSLVFKMQIIPYCAWLRRIKAKYSKICVCKILSFFAQPRTD